MNQDTKENLIGIGVVILIVAIILYAGMCIGSAINWPYK